MRFLFADMEKTPKAHIQFS